MVMFRKTWILLGLLVAVAISATAKAQVETLPKRETFTFPTQMQALSKGLEKTGVKIIYGLNSVPAPEGISEEAKKVWVNLPQLPLLADDPIKLAAMREMSSLGEDAVFDKFKTAYSMEDREVNGITTLWITPPELKHKDKVMIFIHGGAWIVNSRKTQLPLQMAVASSLGVKVVSIEYRLAPEHPYPAALNDVVAAYRRCPSCR